MVQALPVLQLTMKLRCESLLGAHTILDSFEHGAEFGQNLNRAGLVEASCQLSAELVGLPHFRHGLALAVVVFCEGDHFLVLGCRSFMRPADCELHLFHRSDWVRFPELW